MRAKTSGSWWAAPIAPLMLLMGCAAESAPDGQLREADLDETSDGMDIVERAQLGFIISSARQPFLSVDQAPEEPRAVIRESEVLSWQQDADTLEPLFDDDRDIGVAARLPVSLTAPFSLRDRASMLDISVTLEGASPARAEIADGFVVYPAGLDEADVIHRASRKGLEDYVVFQREPRRESLRYTVELGESVAGVRALANIVEFLDVDGMPRLRVAPPYVVESDGTLTRVALSVDGCNFDSNPLPPWTRPPTPPGSRTCTVTVDWGGRGLSYPLLVDPAWSITTDMADERAWHQSARLSASDVLVLGGIGVGCRSFVTGMIPAV